MALSLRVDNKTAGPVQNYPILCRVGDAQIEPVFLTDHAILKWIIRENDGLILDLSRNTWRLCHTVDVSSTPAQDQRHSCYRKKVWFHGLSQFEILLTAAPLRHLTLAASILSSMGT
jgi:hypothetical protein